LIYCLRIFWRVLRVIFAGIWIMGAMICHQGQDKEGGGGGERRELLKMDIIVIE
jgi:hypothetical protein